MSNEPKAANTSDDNAGALDVFLSAGSLISAVYALHATDIASKTPHSRT